jgi:hypothetical protein
VNTGLWRYVEKVWLELPDELKLDKFRVAEVDVDYVMTSHAVLMSAVRELTQAIGWLDRIERGETKTEPQAVAARRRARGNARQAFLDVVNVLERIEAAGGTE